MKEEPKTPGAVETLEGSRRQFGKRLAVLAGTGLLVPALPSAAWPQKAEGPAPTPASSAAVDLPSPLADTLAEAARLRYGNAIDPDHLREIARGLDRGLKAAEKMRQVKLANGDEPEFVFSPRLR